MLFGTKKNVTIVVHTPLPPHNLIPPTKHCYNCTSAVHIFLLSAVAVAFVVTNIDDALSLSYGGFSSFARSLRLSKAFWEYCNNIDDRKMATGAIYALSYMKDCPSATRIVCPFERLTTHSCSIKQALVSNIRRPASWNTHTYVELRGYSNNVAAFHA